MSFLFALIVIGGALDFIAFLIRCAREAERDRQIQEVSAQLSRNIASAREWVDLTPTCNDAIERLRLAEVVLSILEGALKTSGTSAKEFTRMANEVGIPLAVSAEFAAKLASDTRPR